MKSTESPCESRAVARPSAYGRSIPPVSRPTSTAPSRRDGCAVSRALTCDTPPERRTSGTALTERTDRLALTRPLFVRVIRLAIAEDDLASREVELEGHVDQRVQRVADGALSRRRNEQEEESASAGPDELAAECPGGSGGLVERVDVGIRDTGTEASFGQPGFVEKLTELQDVPVAAEDGDALVDEIPHDAELTAAMVDSGDETVRDGGGGASDAGVEQHERRGEFVPAVGADRDRCHDDLAVLVEDDLIQTAIGRQHLILRPDGLLQDVLFQMDALHRET